MKMGTRVDLMCRSPSIAYLYLALIALARCGTASR